MFRRLSVVSEAHKISKGIYQIKLKIYYLCEWCLSTAVSTRQNNDNGGGGDEHDSSEISLALLRRCFEKLNGCVLFLFSTPLRIHYV